jgi:hypothetical protein
MTYLPNCPSENYHLPSASKYHVLQACPMPCLPFPVANHLKLKRWLKRLKFNPPLTPTPQTPPTLFLVAAGSTILFLVIIGIIYAR